MLSSICLSLSRLTDGNTRMKSISCLSRAHQIPGGQHGQGDHEVRVEGKGKVDGGAVAGRGAIEFWRQGAIQQGGAASAVAVAVPVLFTKEALTSNLSDIHLHSNIRSTG